MLPAAGAGGVDQSPEGEARELLGMLGPLVTALSAPLRPPAAAAMAAAASPLLSSPSKRLPLEARTGGGGGGGVFGGEQQVGTPAAATQQQQQEEDEVKAFLKRLPPQGIGRRELAALLLSTLAMPGAAGKLAPAARHELLQVVHLVQHDFAQLPTGQCLVLGELFADAAAAAARAARSPAAGLVPAAAAAPGAHASSGAARRPPPSIRGRRGGLSPAALQQSARLWLARYRLAEAEVVAAALVQGEAAAAAAAATAADEQPPSGMIRYWWATGRLLESAGDMPAASSAYASCQEGLKLAGASRPACLRIFALLGCTRMPVALALGGSWPPLRLFAAALRLKWCLGCVACVAGGRAIELPHCQADGSISLAAVHGKQEALELHTVLEGAGKSAAAGDHAAVVAVLAPVLLCCSDKEQLMLQLDQQQWMRGMQMLLGAASASGSWALALRCHLRLLNALLPHVPQPLLAVIQGKEEEEGGQGPAATAVATASSLHAAAEHLAVQPAAAAALDAAASLLQQHDFAVRAAVSRSGSGRPSSGGRGQPEARAVLTLHPMECAMYKAVQHQLALTVAGCSAALAAAGPAAAESRLNLKVREWRSQPNTPQRLLAEPTATQTWMHACITLTQAIRSSHFEHLVPPLQVNAERTAMCDAGTVLLRMSSLAAGSRRPSAPTAAAAAEAAGAAGLESVDQAQELVWWLCDALGTAQALTERQGRFVQVWHTLLCACLPAWVECPDGFCYSRGSLPDTLQANAHPRGEFSVAGVPSRAAGAAGAAGNPPAAAAACRGRGRGRRQRSQRRGASRVPELGPAALPALAVWAGAARAGLAGWLGRRLPCE